MCCFASILLINILLYFNRECLQIEGSKVAHMTTLLFLMHEPKIQTFLLNLVYPVADCQLLGEPSRRATWPLSPACELSTGIWLATGQERLSLWTNDLVGICFQKQVTKTIQ